jgi:lipopolysaccharide transport system ATP-binding protein
MSDIAIRTEKLSKQYHIGELQKTHTTLRDTLVDVFTAPVRRAGKLLRGQASGAAELDETIWALKDVSLEIERGEVVGIIGRNGAGKSTLLKILSRITEPTTGFADIHGRVGSLLEVGTGFHSELTGRENIYLNGAILGMKRTEIDHKFDDIVAFAEVERFIDTPVKHYSSGMRLRLAFAVAAHLEPEILLVDEVLAVGDASFQKKCLNKMQDVGQQGRTVLLVSHNLGAIVDLCRIALWIDAGYLRMMGPAREIVAQYLRSNASTTAFWERPRDALASSKIALMSAHVFSEDGRSRDVVDFDKPFKVEIVYQVLRPTAGCTVAFRLKNAEGSAVMESSERDSTELESNVRKVGTYRSVCHVPGGLLRHGLYYLAIGAFHEGVEVVEPYKDVLSFEVSAVRCPATDGRRGLIAPILDWTVEFEEGNASH